MAISYRDLVEKTAVLVKLAIQNKVRSDVFCRKLIEFINEYGVVGYAAFATGPASQVVSRQAPADEPSVFAGNRVEDLSKLSKPAREADMTPEQERRLEAADDDGRSLLDDGDAFTDD